MALIDGTSSDDTLTGTSGDDTLNLGAGGDDLVAGKKGGDLFDFDAAFTAADRADGGDGFDTLALNGDYHRKVVFAADSMVNCEQLFLQGGHSYNIVLDDANLAAGKSLNVRADGLSPGQNFKFDGSAETDGDYNVQGGEGDNILIGGAGDDSLSVRIGVDVVRGGAGNDEIRLEDGLRADDRVDGGDGFDDTLVFEGGFDTPGVLTGKMVRNVEAFLIDSETDVAWSLALANSVTAAGANLLVDWRTDGVETFTFDASGETDAFLEVVGGGGGDNLTGGRLDDTLRGRAGDDVLTGGRGGDMLYGQEGSDRFVFTSTGDSLRKLNDLIVDLTEADVIDLSGIDADAGTDGDQAFTLTTSFHHVAGEVVLQYASASDRTYLALDVDGDAKADMLVQINGDQTGFTNFVL
jgi:Ca2+-binding RTX toxin-like protein